MISYIDKSRAAAQQAERLTGPIVLMKDRLRNAQHKALYSTRENTQEKGQIHELKRDLKQLRNEQKRARIYERLYLDYCDLTFAIERYNRLYKTKLITFTMSERFSTIFNEMRAELAAYVAQLLTCPNHADLLPFNHSSYSSECTNENERAALFGLLLWSREHIAELRALELGGLL